MHRQLASEIQDVNEPEYFKLEKLCLDELLGPGYVEHVPLSEEELENHWETGPAAGGAWNPYIMV